jgi:hypothetical protein
MLVLWESVILACLRYLGDTGNLGRERVQFYMIFFNPAEPTIKRFLFLFFGFYSCFLYFTDTRFEGVGDERFLVSCTKVSSESKPM